MHMHVPDHNHMLPKLAMEILDLNEGYHDRLMLLLVNFFIGFKFHFHWLVQLTFGGARWVVPLPRWWSMFMAGSVQDLGCLWAQPHLLPLMVMASRFGFYDRLPSSSTQAWATLRFHVHSPTQNLSIALSRFITTTSQHHHTIVISQYHNATAPPQRCNTTTHPTSTTTQHQHLCNTKNTTTPTPMQHQEHHNISIVEIKYSPWARWTSPLDPLPDLYRSHRRSSTSIRNTFPS